MNTLSYNGVGATTGHRTGLSWPLLVAASTFLLLLTRGGLLADGDTYWHIVSGRWMFQHFAIPTVDPFSYTMAGAPWTAHELLFEIVFCAAFSLRRCVRRPSPRAGARRAPAPRPRAPF